MHATEILSKFAAELKYSDLPDEAVEQTKMYILDYYASCFAGNMVNGVFNRAVREVLSEMGGKKEATALFQEEKLPAANAAFMNAVYAHGADMDDGNRKAMGHVAAHVMSAVFAAAEKLGNVTWADVFTAINVGYEIYNRVAAAAQPGLVHRGFHSTGTAGAIACGAACAKLMGMDSEGIYNTMSLCAVQASGLIIIAESGQSCKPVNPANAAKTGIISAQIISKGVKAPVFPLESQKGWFHAMTDETDESMITENLGKVFTICESYLKPYPSCRHTHCGIEAALKIRERILNGKRTGNAAADASRDGIMSSDIEKISVYIYSNAIRIAGQILVPDTPEDGKFSVHYSLAAALKEGHFNLQDLETEKITDEIRNIIAKTELIPDETMEDKKAGIRGARVVIRMTDGTEYEEPVLIPKGDAANPFSWEDMEQKMYACMKDYYSKDEVRKIADKIRNTDMNKTFCNISEVLA